MPSKKVVEFAESHRTLKPNTTLLRNAVAEERIEVSVYLKPREAHPAALPDDAAERRIALAARRTVEHKGDVALLRAFAQQNKLEVTAVEPARRLVKLAGTAAQLQSAFAVRLGVYSNGKHEFRGFEGKLSMPAELLASIESVLGLDNEPIAEPHLVALPVNPNSVSGHWPNQVGELYNFPTNANGSGQCISIIELGGGYYSTDNTKAFAAMGLGVPTIVPVSVDGALNNPGADPNADGEVALDIQVAGGNAPGARIAVYFTPNTLQGFADAITQAAHDVTNKPSVMSISWGTAEANWNNAGSQAMQTMNTALQDAAILNISVFVAAGDHLGTDNLANERANVDFPASSPFAIGCGGTTIDTTGNAINSETVWNEGATGWGTGGGISDFFAVPSFQQGTTLPPSVNDGQVRRGVPDVSADAAQESGYLVVLNGQTQTIGGTSAVAPLWSGLAALTNQAAAKGIGFFLPQIYADPQPFREILQGNNKPVNSSLGYNAGPGYNCCTGLGAPNGAAFEILMARPGRALGKIASVQWTQQPQLRVYYQGLNNAILEYCCTGNAWTPGATLPMAKPETSLAAVSWMDGTQLQIRVYYQDAGNAIQEYCWAGSGWTKGAALPVAAAGSPLAAVVWPAGNGNMQIRVYYLNSSNVIEEHCWTGTDWTQGATLPAAAAGSALTAVAWPSGSNVQIRVYYQNSANVIQEHCWTGAAWCAGATLPTATQATPLSAVVWPDGSGVQIRVYYQSANSMVQEYCWNGGGWIMGATLPTAVQHSPLSTVMWTDAAGQVQLRVYYQATDTAIHEDMFSATGWGEGAAYLPVVAAGAPAGPSALQGVVREREVARR